MACQGINPNEGRLLGSFELPSDERLDDALAAAEHNFQHKKLARSGAIAAPV